MSHNRELRTKPFWRPSDQVVRTWSWSMGRQNAPYVYGGSARHSPGNRCSATKLLFPGECKCSFFRLVCICSATKPHLGRQILHFTDFEDIPAYHAAEKSDLARKPCFARPMTILLKFLKKTKSFPY